MFVKMSFNNFISNLPASRVLDLSDIGDAANSTNAATCLQGVGTCTSPQVDFRCVPASSQVMEGCNIQPLKVIDCSNTRALQVVDHYNTHPSQVVGYRNTQASQVIGNCNTQNHNITSSNLNNGNTLEQWVHRNNELLADTCEESLERCKRDWMNERDTTTNSNSVYSSINHCLLNDTNRNRNQVQENKVNKTHTQRNRNQVQENKVNKTHVHKNRNHELLDSHNGGYIPYIELESDGDELVELVDLSDVHDASPESIDLTSGIDEQVEIYLIEQSTGNNTEKVYTNDAFTSLLSSCSVTDIEGETARSIQYVDLDNDEHDDEINDNAISVCIDSDDDDDDIVSVHITENSMDTSANDILDTNFSVLSEVVNVEEQNETFNFDLEKTLNCSNNSTVNSFAPILSSYNIVDTEDDMSDEMDSIIVTNSDNNVEDLNDHAFRSILSPFCISNTADMQEDAGDDIIELLSDVDDVNDTVDLLLEATNEISIGNESNSLPLDVPVGNEVCDLVPDATNANETSDLIPDSTSGLIPDANANETYGLIPEVTNVNNNTPMETNKDSTNTVADSLQCVINPSRKRKQKRNRKKKKGNPPPPHIVRLIIERKKLEKRQRQQQRLWEEQNRVNDPYMEEDKNKVEEKDKKDIKKEDVKDEIKAGICEEIPPSASQTQMADIKTEPVEIKTEDAS